jgi:hypothetical protein
LPTAVYKLDIFATGSIQRNIKYLPQAFRNRFQIGERKYFKKGPVLALAMREKKCQHGQQKIITKPATIQAHSDFKAGY